MSSPNTRKSGDFTKLIMHGYEVELEAGVGTEIINILTFCETSNK